MRLHKQPEFARGRRRFRHQHDAACFAIEAINDRDLAGVCDFECEQLAQFRPERHATVWLRRMYEQLRRLVDNEIILRLIDYCEIATRPRLGVTRAG